MTILTLAQLLLRTGNKQVMRKILKHKICQKL